MHIATAPAEMLSLVTMSDCGTVATVEQQLSKKDWSTLAKVLTDRFGGKWKGGKTQAFVFQRSVKASMARALDSGTLPTINPLDFFSTTDATIDAMLEIDDIGDTITAWSNDPDRSTPLRVCEPNGGDGAIARRLRDIMGPYGELVVCELDPDRANELRAQGFTVVEGDFLEFHDETGFDFFVMNPPFNAKGDPVAYATHIEHARSMLRHENGAVVSVVPDFTLDMLSATRERVRAFAETALCNSLGGLFTPLPKNSFKHAGTTVDTAIVAVGHPSRANWLDAPHSGYASGWAWQFMLTVDNNDAALRQPAYRTFRAAIRGGSTLRDAAAATVNSISKNVFSTVWREDGVLIPRRAHDDCHKELEHALTEMLKERDHALYLSLQPAASAVKAPVIAVPTAPAAPRMERPPVPRANFASQTAFAF